MASWIDTKEANIARRMAQTDGELETDIAKYNDMLNRKDDGGFCANRRRADALNEERAARRAIKEVWDV